jgi:uncharacterized protein
VDNWRGKWAVITGASAGIGHALAAELAAGGTNLVLTARRRDRLEHLAAHLSANHPVKAEICTADLAESSGPEAVFAFTQEKGLEMDLLINNAGFGAYGEFTGSELERQLEMVKVNIAAVIHLTHLYLPGMVARGRGDILILASTAAFQAVPYLTTYAATKSFDLLFAEGLAEEVAPKGVHVCALCPGPTTSEFQQVAGTPDRTVRTQETAEKVAHTGLAALAAGKSYVISGAGNYAAAQLERLIPRRVISRTVAKMYRPSAARK